MLVNFLQLALHLDGEVDERCEVHLPLATLPKNVWTVMEEQYYSIISVIVFPSPLPCVISPDRRTESPKNRFTEFPPPLS